jgi:hypothetical protein
LYLGPADLDHGIDAIEERHRDVGNNDVRLEAYGGFDHGRAVGGFGVRGGEVGFGEKFFDDTGDDPRGAAGCGGWSAGCFLFSKAELNAIGLNEAEMLDAYETVAARIGISGAKDDGTPYCLRDLENFQPATEMDNNLDRIYNSYVRKKNTLNGKGAFIGRLGLAVLTRDMKGRKAIQYKDMDYWSDKDRSAYRSWMTIDELSAKPNFFYHDRCLVLKFSEDETGINVHVLRTDTKERQVFRAKKLFLSPGVLGTARIVIRSFDYTIDTLPFMCNPYCYMPCLQWRILAAETQQMKTSFGQLMIALDENGNNFDVAIAALFSYRSLLLFKLIKETPLNFSDGRIIMQYLQSAFTIAGIHHPEKPSSSKFIQMKRTSATLTGDMLTGQYILSDEEQHVHSIREKKFRWALCKLGCWPLRTIYTPPGGSIHYAGTLPFDDSGKPFTINKKGLLAGTRNVYVADGSGFRYLPAKGLTLSLMANAHNVAKNALKNG